MINKNDIMVTVQQSSNDKQTVEAIIDEMKNSTQQEYISSKSCRMKVFNPILHYAELILKAYKREIAERDAKIKSLEDKVSQYAFLNCQNV